MISPINKQLQVAKQYRQYQHKPGWHRAALPRQDEVNCLAMQLPKIKQYWRFESMKMSDEEVGLHNQLKTFSGKCPQTYPTLSPSATHPCPQAPPTLAPRLHPPLSPGPTHPCLQAPPTLVPRCHLQHSKWSGRRLSYGSLGMRLTKPSSWKRGYWEQMLCVFWLHTKHFLTNNVCMQEQHTHTAITNVYVTAEKRRGG